MMIKTILWLPLVMLEYLFDTSKNFDPKKYKPATNSQKKRSEAMRNSGRLAAYYAKRVINKGKYYVD